MSSGSSRTRVGVVGGVAPDRQQSMLAKMRRRREAAKAARVAKRKAAVAPLSARTIVEPRLSAVPSRPRKTKPRVAVAAKPALSQPAVPVPPPITPPCPAVLSVVVPAGIGDVSWLYSKLVTLGCQLRIRGTTAGPQRLRSFLDLLPNVIVLPDTRMSFSTLRERSIKPQVSKAILFTATEEIHMEANTWLETGHKLVDWLPELGLDYHYPININDEAIQVAAALLPDEPFVCIFAGNEGTAANWKAWFAPEWIALMRDFRTRVQPIKFVLIGAKWDEPMAAKIMAAAATSHIPVLNLVAKLPLAASLHVIKQSEYFLAFPSGLGVLANVMSQPATMFYPSEKKQLLKMPGTWSDPASVASNEFHEVRFGDPAALVDWLLQVYGIKGKLRDARIED